jgi:hypothetical protein
VPALHTLYSAEASSTATLHAEWAHEGRRGVWWVSGASLESRVENGMGAACHVRVMLCYAMCEGGWSGATCSV